jgi:O-antigen/teichoic acid export membrane protein
VAGGAILSTGATMIIYAVGFIATVFVAHALGPRGRGEYYVPVTAAAICVNLLSLSVGYSQAYYLAEGRYDLRQLTGASAVVALALAPLAIALMFGVFAVAPRSVFNGISTANYAIAAISVPFQLSLMWLAGLYVLAKRLVRSQVAMLIGATVQTGAAAVLYFTHHLTVQAVLILYLAAVALPWALHIAWAEGFSPVRLRADRTLVRRVLAYGIKLHPGYTAWFLLLRFDTFLVTAYLGTQAVGRYSVAVLFAELMWILVDPLAVAAMPYQASGTIADAAPLTFKAARFSFALSMLLAAGFSATLWFLIPLVYGKPFAGAYPAFLALVPGIVAMATVRPLYYWLIRQRRAGTLNALSLAAFSLNTVANIVLLKPLGIVGAGLASTAAYVGLSVAFAVWGARASNTQMRVAFRPQRADVEVITRLWRSFRQWRHTRRMTGHAG